MKIVVVSYGSRGDIQPFLALAWALKARGHQVLLCAPPASAAFVKCCGVEFMPIGNDFELFESAETRRLLQQGRAREFFSRGVGRAAGLWAGLGRQLVDAVNDADTLVCMGMLNDWAWPVAGKFGLRLVLAYTFPLLENGDYPNPFVTSSSIPSRMARRLTHTLFKWGSWRHVKPMIGDLRTRLGMPRARGPAIARVRAAGVTSLHMWSAAVVPRPREWTDREILTGYWRLPRELRTPLGEATPPTELSEWIACGPAPVFVGFGGMPIEDADATLAMAVSVSRALGLRVLCSFGDRVLPRTLVGDSFFVVRTVDHEWLFPKCLAAVHHGGAGTTGASLTAGIPTLICSVFADQPIWGRRVAQLGVGAHLPFAQLGVGSLTAALQAITREAVSRRASELGARLRDERGLDRAVEIVETGSARRG